MTKHVGFERLQEEIVGKTGFILSDGTLNLEHLLPQAHNILSNLDVCADIRQDIENVFTATEKADESEIDKTQLYSAMYYGFVEISDENMETASELWSETIYNLFNDVAPDGYYFGSIEGDGACIGWFSYVPDEIANMSDDELLEALSE